MGLQLCNLENAGGNMKVLFITSYYKGNYAISSCLRNIFKIMCEQVDIEVAHMDLNDAYVEKLPLKLHHIYNCVDNLKFKEKINRILKDEKGFKKITRLFMYIASRIIMRINISPKTSYAINEAISCKEIDKLISKGEYDCIVSVCAHFSNHYIASKLKKKYKNLKWIAYYFDPYSFSMIDKKNEEAKKKFEYEVLSGADRIVLTNQLKSEFESSFLKKFLSKSVVCEFPNVLNRVANEKNTVIKFDENKINCVFTGWIYSGIRDPEYFLEFLDKADENIKFYIVGGIHQMDGWEPYSKHKGIKDKLEIVGTVSMEESFKILSEADIVVNLGNSVKNQLPSKIFDYMSVSKPIINVCRIKDCPTLPYMNKYPCVLNLFEGENISEEKISEFNMFCKEAKHTEIIFDEIREKFKTSSPEYVAEQIMKLLK